AQENNNAGNGQQQSNSTGNGQQQSNSTGNGQQQSNSTGNAQENNNTGNGQQQSNSANNTGNASADFVNTILEIHNRERAAVSVQPLVWNDTLAAGAKTWADHLVATGKFEHKPVSPEGENIAAQGTPPAENQTQLAQMAESWAAEKNNHQGVASGNVATAGHYLQMTSRAAKGVGCGTASGGPQNWDVLVCRYSPPGWDSWVMNQTKLNDTSSIR
ncbi:MAG: CAP domain-containing protein, partial [Candidatus Nitrosopolaris sp.]